MKLFFACVALVWLKPVNSAVIYIGKSEAVDYDTARQGCLSMTFTGQLATWSSQAQYVSMASTKTSDYAWVGLNDLSQEGKWRMIDGDTTYCDDFDGTDCDNIPQWGAGEPNEYDHDTEDGEGEDCAHLGGNDNKLNDLPCSHALHYVCEINVAGNVAVADVEPVAAPNNYYTYTLEVTSIKDIVVLASVLLNVALFVCVCYLAGKARKSKSAYSKVSMYATEDEKL